MARTGSEDQILPLNQRIFVSLHVATSQVGYFTSSIIIAKHDNFITEQKRFDIVTLYYFYARVRTVGTGARTRSIKRTQPFAVAALFHNIPQTQTSSQAFSCEFCNT